MADDAITVTQAQYESAVKGRQDFRNAYRNLLPVLRAAKELSRLWRTNGQRVDGDEFFDAINAIDVAVTGGGAMPDPEHLTRTTSLAAQDDPDEAYEIGKRDGYEQAVQEIDVLTGGDGEYRYCTNGDPDRHTPDAATMKARIADRFNAAPSLAAHDGLVEALELLLGYVRKSRQGYVLVPLADRIAEVTAEHALAVAKGQDSYAPFIAEQLKALHEESRKQIEQSSAALSAIRENKS